MTASERGENGSGPVASDVGKAVTEVDAVLSKLGAGVPQGSQWQMILAGISAILIGVAVFVQLFRDGGLVQPGGGTEGSMLLLYPASAALVLAVAADWRLALRAVLSLPVLALIGLAALSWVSGYWSIVDVVEADRIAFAIAGYAVIAIAAAVIAARLTVLPLTGLLIVVAVVAGAMGLWGYANFEQPLAVVNQGELTPAGPFRYRNTLALLAAASIIPLIRWSVWDGLDKPRVLLSVVSGLALGVSITVVATSGSDFAWLMTFALVAIAIVFPGRTLGMSRQDALGMSAAVVIVGFLGWLMFKKVLSPMPGEESLRTVVMVGLVVLTPLLAWASGLGAARIGDRLATRLVQGGAVLVVVGAFLFLIDPSAPGDVTQSRQAYYEATIETALEEPVKGTGAGSYAVASIDSQLSVLSSQTRFAHTIPGEMWVELGLGGLVLSILLYAGALLFSWRTRTLAGGALLIPLVAGFLFSGLIDWSWHMQAMTALWAAGLGGLVGLWSTKTGGGGSDEHSPESASASSA